MSQGQNHDFNSSDIEFEERTSKLDFKFGQASIDKIIADAQSDRISSKKTTKQLEFGYGAPGTMIPQALWVRRFNVFREQALGQRLDRPFTGDDMLRFLDAIIGKVVPTHTGKPCPNASLVFKAFKILVSYGTFTYAENTGFKITKQDGLRFKAFVDDAVKSQRVMKGTWGKRVWVGFATLSRLVRNFLDHARRYSTRSWDVVICKSFGVVLVAALGSRAGDVVRTVHYKGDEYMKYRDIDLYLELDDVHTTPTLHQLRATITMQYTKGHKNSMNEDVVRYIAVLQDDESRHVCPITLLLIHALRHGLAHGTTLQQVLDHAATTPGLRVQWTQPDYPVLPAFTTSGVACDLSKPTDPRQLLDSIKEMGLISGMLGRVYTHGLRLGAARDVSHLPRLQHGTGIATDETRESLGHTFKSMHNGIVDRYAGETSRDLYSDRVKNKSLVHRREPVFIGPVARDIVRQPVTEAEIYAALDVPQPTPSEPVQPLTNVERDRARRHVRAVRQRDLSLASTLIAPPPRLQGPSAGQPSTPRKALTNLSPNFSIKKRQPTSKPPVEKNQNDLGLAIDPRLLDEETLEASQVSPDKVQSLYDTALNPHASSLDDISNVQETQNHDFDNVEATDDVQTLAEETRLVLHQVDFTPQTGPNASPAHEWVDEHARINVIQNQKFVAQWRPYEAQKMSFEASVGPHCRRGNSRDEPTPFLWACTKTEGCTHTTIYKHNIHTHEEICDEDYVKAALAKLDDETPSLACNEPDCDFVTYNGEHAMKSHQHERHNWISMACPEAGCNDKTVFATRKAFSRHKLQAHSQWPSKCLFPGCTEVKSFADRRALERHLNKAHAVTDRNHQIQYLPARPQQEKWIAQRCLFGGCPSTAKFLSLAAMRSHLETHHGMEQKAALDLISAKATMEVYQPATAVGPKHSKFVSAPAPGPVKRPWEDAQLPAGQKYVSQQCFIHGCEITNKFARVTHLRAHLENDHDMETAEARQLIYEQAETAPYKVRNKQHVVQKKKRRYLDGVQTTNVEEVIEETMGGEIEDEDEAEDNDQ